MINSKLFKLAAMTMASAAISHSASASAGDALCSDWSYNDPDCPAYINSSAKTVNTAPPVQIAENNTKQVPGSALCADWSYNDPNCPAYIKSPGK